MSDLDFLKKKFWNGNREHPCVININMIINVMKGT